MYAMCCATVVAYASYCCRLFGRVFGPPQRLTALAKRVLLIKADSSLLIFSELGSYKPLNWMTAPCTIREIDPAAKSAQHSRESVAGGAVDGDSATHSPESVAAGEPEKVLRVSADKGSDILEVTLSAYLFRPNL